MISLRYGKTGIVLQSGSAGRSGTDRPLVAVYGLGRFGYFWADLLSREYDVIGVSRTPGRPVPSGVEKAVPEDLPGAGVVFLCVAISAFEEALEGITPYLAPGTVVIDTCSVKVHPVSVMRRVLPDSIEIIASHPMFGPDSGRDGVQDLPVVICPVRCRSETFRYWRESFSRTFGLRLIEMTPEQHDQEAAHTQGVTHFVGRVLSELGLKESAIGTVGYQKILQVVEQTCNDPYQLFLDLQRYNPYTPAMRQRLEQAFLRVRDGLDACNAESGPSELPGNADASVESDPST